VQPNENLRAGDPAVNTAIPVSETPSAQGSVRIFTPHRGLVFAVFKFGASALGLSVRARDVLMLALMHSGSRGQGEGCAPHEAMFWRTRGEIVRELGASEGTVKRAHAELRARGFLRWRLVHPGQKLPSGYKSHTSVAVYYVDLHTIHTGLGTDLARRDQIDPGTDRARRDQIDLSREINSGIETRLIPGKNGPASSLNRSQIVNHRTTTTGSAPQPPTPGGGGGGLEFDPESPAGRLLAYWWERRGRTRCASDALDPVGKEARAVHAQIRDTIAAGETEETCRLAIDAACDVAIGGRAWAYVHERRDSMSDTALFRGCFTHLVRAGRAYLAKTEKVLKRPPLAATRPEASSAPTDPGSARETAAALERMGMAVPAVIRNLLRGPPDENNS